ncbi:NADP-dependent aldehyde dehydrogenase [Tamaricihabitans halophyticus]|uniref:NADP-dependent aldehyde dehydrogenase n=1 Tax=Tamaricihabitans halophyticus TaxID=1262583 RepID=A0A4R2Q9G3_9PSEU|nr:aldehyde dehydrogenase (NADP(+)) [Tamaricihabitans halophyticus]TCP43441.1 NADP-dependent aldehyde dehydrogenase [Tamaricihabitans halophyticus]
MTEDQKMTTDQELDAAVQIAKTAFEAAAEVAPADRAQWLIAVADELDAHAEELVPLAMAQTNLPEPRLRGELARTTFQLRLLAGEIRTGEQLDARIDHADPDWGMGPRPDLRRVNVPLGVVAVFGASNFPFAFSVLGGDTAAALAAGCAVVHKVHEAHAELGTRTATVAARALERAGAPAGLIVAVTGRRAGERLVEHPLVRAVGFTGSTRVGRMLFDRASSRPEPIPFYGELGSVNPVFVTETAWRERGPKILRDYLGSVTLGMGQFCTKPGLLFVPRLDAEATTVLAEAAGAASPMLSESIASSFHAGLAAAREDGELTELLSGGGSELAPEPTVLATTAAHVRGAPDILRTEIFGPASVIVEYESEAELLALVELLEGQLTATIHDAEGEYHPELLAALQAKSGRLIHNGWPTGVSVTHAQQHGGPYPATTAPTTTSVGTAAISRFLRPVAYQDFPEGSLPAALRTDNPWSITRRVNGERQLAGR